MSVSQTHAWDAQATEGAQGGPDPARSTSEGFRVQGLPRPERHSRVKRGEGLSGAGNDVRQGSEAMGGTSEEAGGARWDPGPGEGPSLGQEEQAGEGGRRGWSIDGGGGCRGSISPLGRQRRLNGARMPHRQKILLLRSSHHSCHTPRRGGGTLAYLFNKYLLTDLLSVDLALCQLSKDGKA